MTDLLSAAFPDVVFGHDVQCIGIGSTRIGPGSCIGDGAWLNVSLRDDSPRLVIGDCVLVGRRSVLSSGTYLELGAHSTLAPNVYLASVEHQYRGNHLRPLLHCGIRDLGRLIVEENCWLGMNAVITGDITIGRGSVVGANSVVRTSVPPFSVVAGAPARIVRMLNSITEQWEPVNSAHDRERLEEARIIRPLPNREQFHAQLTAANQGQSVLPIVAGRGEHML
ncbi:MAG: acyltransferase [Myxococcales bacterium]|nr:acyltransferase [Myxococcales bacterium]